MGSGRPVQPPPPGAKSIECKGRPVPQLEDVTEKVGIRFTHVAAPFARYIPESMSGGVILFDYDRDGWLDIYFTNAPTVDMALKGQKARGALYHNNHDGTFTDVTDKAGIATPCFAMGGAVGDYNNDGWPDLYITCVGGNVLYRNNGDGTFTDVSERSGIAKVAHRYAMTAVAADFDDDGWPDIFVACDSTPSILYHNNRNGTFTDIALEAGVAYNEDGREQAGMGVAIGDVLNSGRLDIFKTHFADDTPILYCNNGNNHFEDMTAKAGFSAFTRYVGWGAGFADFDNDGFLDLLFVNGNVYPELEQFFKGYKYRNPRILLRNLGTGVFENVSDRGGPAITEEHSSRGCAFGDFDNDGNVDVAIMNMGECPSLLRNETKNSNRWLKLKLIGTKSNRSAIGAKAFVSSNGRRQRQEVLSQSSFYSQSDLRLHFGLGSATTADVEVHWPSGMIETYGGVKTNQILPVREGG
jgi:hypothetical protein